MNGLTLPDLLLDPKLYFLNLLQNCRFSDFFSRFRLFDKFRFSKIGNCTYFLNEH